MISNKNDALPYLTWLEHNGYRDIKLVGRSRWAATCAFTFTHAIILGKIGNLASYDDRWCYCTRELAQQALAVWDGSGEPTGWHRHPASGRRVADIGDFEVTSGQVDPGAIYVRL